MNMPLAIRFLTLGVSAHITQYYGYFNFVNFESQFHNNSGSADSQA